MFGRGISSYRPAAWAGHRSPAHHRWRHGGGGLHRRLRRADRDGAAPGIAGAREALPLCEQGLGCLGCAWDSWDGTWIQK